MKYALIAFLLAGCVAPIGPLGDDVVFTDTPSNSWISRVFGQRIAEGCAVTPDAAGC